MNLNKTFAAFCLGCRTNQAEIEEIGEKLIKLGWICDIKNPFVVILNTCVVTAKAELETRKEIRKLKRQYPKAKVVVLGCAVDGQKLGIKLPQADLLIDNQSKTRTEILIEKNLFGKKTVHFRFASPVSPEQRRRGETATSKYSCSGRKFVKIQDGCDKFCSYCLTCLVRGRPRSLKKNEIIDQIQKFIVNGGKEIILTGINISLFGKNTNYSLVQLIKSILQTNIERLSLSSIHPEIINDQFINLITSNLKISQYLHLSLQSGSPTVLKRMNRTTDLTKLLSQIKKIKKLNRNFVFRADIIVGFPGEDEKEFNETIEFIRKSRISFAHIFRYSPRTGTLADKKVRNKEWQLIDKQTIKGRIIKLKKIIAENKIKQFAGLNNKTVRCLITQPQKGIIENGIEIDFEEKNKKIGVIIPVFLSMENNKLIGSPIF